MGYYVKTTNYYSEVYTLQNEGITEMPAIVITNNENITFDFSSYYIKNEDDTKNPYEKIKIKIDYGDGNKETLIKPLTNKGKIWDKIKHHYNFTDPEIFNNGGNIVIEIKNIEGITDKITIPFEILESTSTSYNVALELLNANLTNDSRISFILNNLQDNQIILAKD